MDNGSQLYFATAAFIATHFIPSTPLRGAMVKALGERTYVVLYSLVAFVTLGWMIWAFEHAPFVNLWYAVALRPVPLVAMPFALVFVVCGLATPNPTAVGREKLLDGDAPVRAAVGHEHRGANALGEIHG